MNNWKKSTLAELCTEITYGYTESAKREVIGPKFLRITDIASGRIEWQSVPYCSINESDYIKYQLFPGDIVVARTGASTGVNYTIKKTDPAEVVFASYLIRYKINEQIANPFFIGHMLRSSKWSDYIDAIAGGSAQPGANAKQIGSFEIVLPPLETQRAIASILSSLDDKIDLLHRQNATLEKMAETLFRQWFVVEAKEEWEDRYLDDVLSVRGGSTPSTTNSEFWDGDINWTSPKDVTSLEGIFLFDTDRRITEAGLKKISSGLLPKGTLLMSSRAPVGVLAFSEIPIAINQGYIAIIDDKGCSKQFLYLWLKANMDYVQSYANGSTFQEISKSSFRSLEIKIPPASLRLRFQVQIDPIFKKIRANQIQVRTLTALRDSILPKLMSGEMRVQV